MNLVNACIAVLAFAFWRLVALNAGPRHPAYLHATRRAHINAMTFHRFITGETQ